MKQPTYKEQFDKITSAYFKNQLDPGNSCACFIGNMLNKTCRWGLMRTIDNSIHNGMKPRFSGVLDPEYGFYTIEEICAMETNFLATCYPPDVWQLSEENLFAAMDSTLDMLRQIHESKGEITEVQPFTKRQLV